MLFGGSSCLEDWAPWPDRLEKLFSISLAQPHDLSPSVLGRTDEAETGEEQGPQPSLGHKAGKLGKGSVTVE